VLVIREEKNKMWTTNRVLDGGGVTIPSWFSITDMADEPVVEETEIARSVVVGVEGIITRGERSLRLLEQKEK
jgi:hypothetical protein